MSTKGIKVAIANYGNHQLEYLNRNIEMFNSFTTLPFDLTVYSTVPISFPRPKYSCFKFRQVLVDPSIGKGLPFVCRQDMINDADNYELFIYNENDMLITEDNVAAFLQHSHRLDGEYVSGFIRYELDSAGNKVLLDPNPHWGPVTSEKTETHFRINNQHQGCWILLQQHLKRAIASGGFVLNAHDTPYGPLEQGASDPYTQCGLKKVFPTDYNLCERLLIHHMPNKYIKYPEWINHGLQLKQLFASHL